MIRLASAQLKKHLCALPSRNSGLSLIFFGGSICTVQLRMQWQGQYRLQLRLGWAHWRRKTAHSAEWKDLLVTNCWKQLTVFTVWKGGGGRGVGGEGTCQKNILRAGRNQERKGCNPGDKMAIRNFFQNGRLTGRARWQNTWRNVMAYRPSTVRSVCHDREPNIFLSSPT